MRILMASDLFHPFLLVEKREYTDGEEADNPQNTLIFAKQSKYRNI